MLQQNVCLDASCGAALPHLAWPSAALPNDGLLVGGTAARPSLDAEEIRTAAVRYHDVQRKSRFVAGATQVEANMAMHTVCAL